MDKPPHLLVSISAHGYGHVAQTAPVINALRERVPDLRLSIRSEVPLTHLQSRFSGPFDYLREPGDMGMVMSSAMDVHVDESAAAYAVWHREWGIKVQDAAAHLRDLAPDFVLSNVGYLMLAGAHHAGIPCAAMCSLNWADIYAHYCGDISGAHQVEAHIRQSYANADAFLRLTPGMAMPDLHNLHSVGPVAAVGHERRAEIEARLGAGQRLVLVSLGGVAGRLPIERWPRCTGIRWLVPASWHVAHPDAVVLESLGMPFLDVLASSDALICKPGYGSFVEAACAGIPVLYVDRADWPETSCLTAWMQQHGRCCEVARSALEKGEFLQELQMMWAKPTPEIPLPSGVEEVADWLAGRLLRWP